MSNRDPLLPNTLIVARREYDERVGSRLFHLSTILLAVLAVVVAFIPLFARAVGQAQTTTIGVVASDDALAARATGVLAGFLGRDESGSTDASAVFSFVRVPDAAAATDEVVEGRLDAALITERAADGALDFSFLTGDSIGPDRIQLISVAGTFAVALLDWTERNRGTGAPFRMPAVNVETVTGPEAGGVPLDAAEVASRRIVGVVFVVLTFITLVIYGMWVAAGVVTEKANRVMELMISAASPAQLVIGKVLGIGAAGLTQAVAILVPAVLAIAVEDPIARALFGPGPSVAPSLAGLSVGLIAAFLVFFVLGFALYALIYAAAGSLVSRAEDLQMLALPLSVVAIVGYLQAVLALSGGSPGFVRLASYIPFWSPFVMLTRLSVGRVEPWELVLSLVLLVATIAVTLVVAIRIYAAGVLLYGQRPSLRTIVAAVRG